MNDENMGISKDKMSVARPTSLSSGGVPGGTQVAERSTVFSTFEGGYREANQKKNLNSISPPSLEDLSEILPDPQNEVKFLVASEFNRMKGTNPSFSLRAFARKLEVHASALSEFFNGKRNISYRMAQKLLKNLKVQGDLSKKILESFHLQKRKGAQLKRVSKASHAPFGMTQNPDYDRLGNHLSGDLRSSFSLGTLGADRVRNDLGSSGHQNVYYVPRSKLRLLYDKMSQFEKEMREILGPCQQEVFGPRPATLLSDEISTGGPLALRIPERDRPSLGSEDGLPFSFQLNFYPLLPDMSSLDSSSLS